MSKRISPDVRTPSGSTAIFVLILCPSPDRQKRIHRTFLSPGKGSVIFITLYKSKCSPPRGRMEAGRRLMSPRLIATCNSCAKRTCCFTSTHFLPTLSYSAFASAMEGALPASPWTRMASRIPGTAPALLNTWSAIRADCRCVTGCRLLWRMLSTSKRQACRLMVFGFTAELPATEEESVQTSFRNALRGTLYWSPYMLDHFQHCPPNLSSEVSQP
mmetsp:Transcript_35489/g.57144  ORF Transcript_35489/g.57144 Transcript_35489/m.57144 type:complete len:216 (-) Transcript_35489:4836-5483(-)